MTRIASRDTALNYRYMIACELIRIFAIKLVHINECFQMIKQTVVRGYRRGIEIKAFTTILKPDIVLGHAIGDIAKYCIHVFELQIMHW